MSQSAKQRAASIRNLAKARKATKGHSTGAAPHRAAKTSVAAVHAIASPIAHRKSRLRKIHLHL